MNSYMPKFLKLKATYNDRIYLYVAKVKWDIGAHSLDKEICNLVLKNVAQTEKSN